jgi:hypothetical protein
MDGRWEGDEERSQQRGQNSIEDQQSKFVCNSWLYMECQLQDASGKKMEIEEKRIWICMYECMYEPSLGTLIDLTALI